jgi:hypothetical protein
MFVLYDQLTGLIWGAGTAKANLFVLRTNIQVGGRYPVCINPLAMIRESLPLLFASHASVKHG